MSNPFREALDADKSIGTKKPKKKPVVKDIVKILENEDAVDPDAVYTEEQLTDIASESDEAASSLRARLEDLRYEVETIYAELDKRQDDLRAVYNDMTYGQQHDLIGPGERISDRVSQFSDAKNVLDGMADRIASAVSIME